MTRAIQSSLTAAVMLALGVTAAPAGDENLLSIIQTGPAGLGTGNSLTSDQSLASRSLVGGPSGNMISLAREGELNVGEIERGSGAAAVQSGQGNTATLTIVGAGGELQLLQDNSAEGSAGAGNTATLDALGSNALGAVLQIGDGNTANLSLAADAEGLIVQNGIGNLGALTVESSGAGELVQNGNGNVFPTTVAAGTTVTVTQNGNNLSPAGVTGLQVFSTAPGTISITQTGF